MPNLSFDLLQWISESLDNFGQFGQNWKVLQNVQSLERTLPDLKEPSNLVLRGNLSELRNYIKDDSD